MDAGSLFLRLIPLLEDASISYMITGSVASSVHGIPRSTRYIDMVIRPNRASLMTFVRSLADDQYYVSEESALRAFAGQGQFNIIDYATGWKVDFIIRKNRPFSVAEFDRRMVEKIQGRSLFVAGAEDVLTGSI